MAFGHELGVDESLRTLRSLTPTVIGVRKESEKPSHGQFLLSSLSPRHDPRQSERTESPLLFSPYSPGGRCVHFQKNLMRGFRLREHDVACKKGTEVMRMWPESPPEDGFSLSSPKGHVAIFNWVCSWRSVVLALCGRFLWCPYQWRPVEALLV